MGGRTGKIRTRSIAPEAASGEIDAVAHQLDRLDAALARRLERADGARPTGRLARIGDRFGGVRTARDLVRRLDRVVRSRESDDFGADPEFQSVVRPLFDSLYRRWWRVEVEGIERVPAEGRVLVIAGGTRMPAAYAGPMLVTALRVDHPGGRELRLLVASVADRVPFASATLMRAGAVRAYPQNAERLLERDHAVGFVLGDEDDRRPTGATRVGPFGLAGMIDVGLRAGAPIVPVALSPRGHANPRIRALTARIGIPSVWRLPRRITMRFGEPIDLADTTPGTAADRVREAIRALTPPG